MERQAEEKDKKRIYTAEDCDRAGQDCSIKGKVVVIRAGIVLEGGHQLAFCMGGSGADPGCISGSVLLTDLQDGERIRLDRADMVGLLKPELLPEDAKLQLSQIRPIGAVPLTEHEPLYSGYSFLEDGRYAAGVWLCSEKEALDYVEMQKPYQHKVMLCDRNDFCVMEVVDGEMVFPKEEDIRKAQEQADGSMELT